MRMFLLGHDDISKSNNWSLQTAGSVQACQHLLDLVKCRSQMFLSIQSPTEADRSLGVSLIVATEHYHCWTTGIHSTVPSSAGGRKETPGLHLVVRTLYFGAFVLIYWRYS